MSRHEAPMDYSLVGGRLRRARQQGGLSIRDVAEKAGVSKTSVVRLEKGHEIRESTLVKIAAVLGFHIDSLTRPALPGEKSFALHRSEDSKWYDLAEFTAGAVASGDLGPEALRQIWKQGCQSPLNILASRLEAGRIKPTVMALFEESKTRSHPGEEHVYVLEGTARIIVSGQAVTLQAGESVTFWSAEPHSYGPEPGSDLPARILSVRVDST